MLCHVELPSAPTPKLTESRLVTLLLSLPPMGCGLPGKAALALWLVILLILDSATLWKTLFPIGNSARSLFLSSFLSFFKKMFIYIFIFI